MWGANLRAAIPFGRMRGFTGGITVRLFGMLLLAVVPLVGFRAVELVDERAHLIEGAGTKALEIARHGAELYKEPIVEAQTLLQVASQVPEVVAGSPDTCAAFLRKAERDRGWANGLWVIGTDGRVVCTTVPNGIGRDVSDRDFFRQAMQNRGLVISDFFIERLRGQPASLALLPRYVFAAHLRSGLAEVIKSAMIAPSTLEHVLDSHLWPVAAGDPLRALELIIGCVRVKADIVAMDQRESGPRQALNLGHTLAHGLEGAGGYRRFLHGEAVAWGLLAELRLARDRGLLSTAEAQAWADRIHAMAPLPDLEGLPWDSVAPFVARDKKRQGGRVGWVLPRLGGVVLDVAIGTDEAAAVYAKLSSLPPQGPFNTLF